MRQREIGKKERETAIEDKIAFAFMEKEGGSLKGRTTNIQGCDRYKYFGSPNQIQNQIRLVLLILTDTKIRYH